MSECHCRVPLAEVVPIFGSDTAAKRWLADRKVKVLHDWAGRPCVDVPTAKRLHDEAVAASEQTQRDFARKQAKEKGELEAEEARVRDAYKAAYDQAKRRGVSNPMAASIAREAAQRARDEGVSS